MILLYPTKFRVNRIIIRRDIAKRRFSIWRPSAILNLQNFSILLSSRPSKYTLHLRTKFRWNRMISCWDIAIKLFSKWRPSAILHFQNLVFWSCVLCWNVILLYPTNLRVNPIIIRRDIAKSSRPWKNNLHLSTKFRWNRMISGWDITIKLFFKMAAVRHLEFSKFGILVMWPVLERHSALSYKISH